MTRRQPKSKTSKSSRSRPSEPTPGRWQAQKSKIVQEAILKAAAECLADEGYSKFTFEAIARRAGISPGGMQYHFRSRLNLITLMMRYIFDEHLKQSRTDPRKEGEPVGRALHERRLETEWRYLQLPYYIGFVELAMAGRNDPALRKIVRQEYRLFMRRAWKQSIAAMPEWCTDMKKFEFTAELVSTVLEGMRLRQLFGQSNETQDRLIRSYLAQVISTIFESSHNMLPTDG